MEYRDGQNAELLGDPRDPALRAFEIRNLFLHEASKEAPCPLVFVTVELPGGDMHPPGLHEAYTHLLGWVAQVFVKAIVVWEGQDALGPYRAFLVNGDATALKETAILLEENLPGGRLLRIDVYKTDGMPLRRRHLGLPPRTCLVCNRPAEGCVHAGDHEEEEIRGAVSLLIDLARAP